MVLATDGPVSRQVIDRLVAAPGILDVHTVTQG
jgi:hypothetical protein